MRSTIHCSLINVASKILMMSKVHHLLFFRHRETADNMFQNHASGQFPYLYYYQLKPQFTLFFSALLFFPIFLFFFPSLSLSVFLHHSVQPHRGHLQVKR